VLPVLLVLITLHLAALRPPDEHVVHMQQLLLFFQEDVAVILPEHAFELGVIVVVEILQ